MATAAARSATQSASTGDDASVFQLIQSHQEKAARLPLVEEIRTLLDRSVCGMLSTFSQKHEGYPSGSMVDFACDEDGSPILAVSSLAVHTKDLALNPKCSLLVAKDRTDLVVTLHGDAIPVSEKDQAAIRTAYLAKHPNAFSVDFGDFQFMRIEPKVVRYVSGVATALLGSGEFGSEEYKAAKVDPIAKLKAFIVHADDTTVIVQHSTSIPVDSAYILDLDSLGFSVKARYQGDNFKLRIPFPRRAEDGKDVRTLLMEMIEAALAHGCYSHSTQGYFSTSELPSQRYGKFWTYSLQKNMLVSTVDHTIQEHAWNQLLHCVFGVTDALASMGQVARDLALCLAYGSGNPTYLG